MTTWQPISLGQPTVVGTDPEHSGLTVVSIRLSRYPEEGWLGIFGDGVGYGSSVSDRPFQLNGDEITVSLTKEELKRHMNLLKEMVEVANRRYVEEVVPKLEAQARRNAAVEAERKKTQDDMQREIDSL
jgi:hypothetical protein